MVRSEAVSTPTKKKKKSKSLEVRKSKCSKSKEKSSATNSSATGISKRKKKRNKKAAVVDDGCTGGLKLLKRHTVTMTSLTKAQVLKDPLEVELDQHGDPLEANGSNLQSYTGVLARTKVPINIESWPKVGKLLKNTIWDTILESFDLQPSERKMVIKSAGSKWREFKSRLTCQYVLPYIDDPESLKFPPDDYRFITPDVWKDFVKSRLTPEFLEKHEKQRERRLQNQYNHRMSRKGYRGLKCELIKMGIPEEDIDRTLLWIKGHQGKNGEFRDEALMIVNERIEELREKQRNGEFTQEGAVDVLTAALKTPEHTGRVRGVGGYVACPNQYFSLPKRRKQSVTQSTRLSVRQIMFEEQKKMEEQLKEKIAAEEREKIVAEEREKIVAEEKEKLTEEIREKILKEETDKIKAAQDAYWSARIDEMLENKLNERLKGVAAVLPVVRPKSVGNEHTSGQASCSHAVEESIGPSKKQKTPITADALANCLAEMERDTVQKLKNKKKKNSKVKKSQSALLEDDAVNLVELVDMTVTVESSKVQAFPEETECKLALGSTDHFVALATFCTNDDPSTVCHGYAMGDDKLRVSIHTAIEEKALIPFPVGDEIKTVKQAMGSWVMWPKNLIIYNENKKKASGKVRPKRKYQQHNESEDDKFDFQQLHHLDLPATVKKLCQWGEEGFVVRDFICFYKEEDVFGHRAKSYLMGSDVMRLAKLTPASGGLIVVYMMYLHDVLKANLMLDMVAFVDPSIIGEYGCGSAEERTKSLTDRMTTASPNQIFLLPYNPGSHWVLTVVDPDNEIVYHMDPLKRRVVSGQWKEIVNNAISNFNSDRNKKGRRKINWKNMRGIPEQNDTTSCGYYVMRYMRDIVLDTELTFADKWASRTGKPCPYEQVKIDEVRDELAGYVLKNMID